jgi:hypothetical protein
MKVQDRPSGSRREDGFFRVSRSAAVAAAALAPPHFTRAPDGGGRTGFDPPPIRIRRLDIARV